MPIQHLVTLTWRPATTDADVDRISAALRDLADTLPGVESYEVGTDLRLHPGNATLGIAARFTDEAAFLAYRDHPRHQQINAELVAPHLAAKTAVQFEVAGDPGPASRAGGARSCAATDGGFGPEQWRAAVLSTLGQEP